MGEIINFDEMENTTKEDLIAKYSGVKPYAPLQHPAPQTPPTEKVEYEGLTLHSKGRSNRFRIIDKEGTSYGCGYAYLIGWVFTPPSMLTINTSTHICTIEGRGLEEIDRALLEERGYKTEWGKECLKRNHWNKSKPYQKFIGSYNLIGDGTRYSSNFAESIRADVAKTYYDVMYGEDRGVKEWER